MQSELGPRSRLLLPCIRWHQQLIRHWAAVSAASLLVIVAVCVDVRADDAPGNDVWKEKFLDQAPREWEKLDAAVFQWHGTFDQRWQRFANGNPSSPANANRVEYFFDKDLDGFKYVISSIPDNGAHIITGFNKTHDFRISEGGYSRKPFLSGYWLRTSDDEAVHGNTLGQNLVAAKEVYGFELADLVSGKDGRLISAAPVQLYGKTLVRLAFQIKYSLFPNNIYPCTVVVDPDFHWAITEFEQMRPWGVLPTRLVRGKVEYQPQIKDVAFPQRISYDVFEPSGALVISYVDEFSPPSLCKATPKDFTLEAYNVEEPSGSNTGFVTFGLINSGILVGLGIFFSLLARRAMRRSPTTS